MSRPELPKGVETEYTNVSDNTIKVIAQWLKSNYAIFEESFLEPRALMQLIRNNLHQVLIVFQCRRSVFQSNLDRFE